MLSESAFSNLKNILKQNLNVVLEPDIPFNKTGKSAVYFGKTPEIDRVVVKVMFNREEEWTSKFLYELKIVREIEETNLFKSSPKLLFSIESEFVSIWEHIEGSHIGVWRFFSEKMTGDQSEDIIENILPIKKIRPVRRANPDEIAKLHTELQNNEFLSSDVIPGLNAVIEKYSSVWEFAHSDLLPGNIFLTKNGVSIIDWEHANMRLPFFDLAFLWVMGLFSETHRQSILRKVDENFIDVFWTNVIFIALNELRNHKGVNEAEISKSGKTWGQIKEKLDLSLSIAKRNFQNNGNISP